jgi:hypothetical protein
MIFTQPFREDMVIRLRRKRQEAYVITAPAGVLDRRILSAARAATSALATLGADPMVIGPAEFDKLIADETEKWAKMIKFAGIKAE